MEFKQLEVGKTGPNASIGMITFARPEKMNALTKVMEAELRAAFEMFDHDDQVRVIVLTGKGRAFCAGMDIDELEVLPPDDIRAAEWMRSYDMNRRADYQARYTYMPAVKKPVISAINGAAAGLGLVFALYSDIRFASESAVFSTAFSKRGLIAEHGIAWILPRVVGPGHAADLLYSARKVTAQEGRDMGLVNRVFPHESLMDETLKFASELASNVSPRSMRVMKEQLWESPFQTLGESVSLANKEMFYSIQSEDFTEGVRHFIEKRPANFTGK
jgi:enoyl-CoA hydratase/carnithine racemase